MMKSLNLCLYSGLNEILKRCHYILKGSTITVIILCRVFIVILQLVLSDNNITKCVFYTLTRTAELY